MSPDPAIVNTTTGGEFIHACILTATEEGSSRLGMRLGDWHSTLYGQAGIGDWDLAQTITTFDSLHCLKYLIFS